MNSDDESEDFCSSSSNQKSVQQLKLVEQSPDSKVISSYLELGDFEARADSTTLHKILVDRNNSMLNEQLMSKMGNTNDMRPLNRSEKKGKKTQQNSYRKNQENHQCLDSESSCSEFGIFSQSSVEPATVRAKVNHNINKL